MLAPVGLFILPEKLTCVNNQQPQVLYLVPEKCTIAMKEIQSVVNAYQRIDFNSHKASLATVVRVEGSSYRRTGARMLVVDDGNYLGGISGGCLEGDALRRAQKAISANKPSVITYDTTQDDGHQIGVGLGCNGIIDVLFTPLDPADANNPVRTIEGLTTTRVPRIVVWITGCSDNFQALGKLWRYDNDAQFRESFALPALTEQVLQDIHHCRETLTSRTFFYTAGGEQVKVFVEVILPVMHLVIYGGNYDMYPLVRIARELGWDISVVTNVTKADKSLFTTATKVLHNKGEEQPLIDHYTAVLLMTHDYKTDYGHLQRLLATDAGYIGLLGPRKRSQKMFDAMKEEGKVLSAKDAERIYAPSGLNIGANAPEEIALSIVAEIISHYSKRPGTPLRLKEGTIHD